MSCYFTIFLFLFGWTLYTFALIYLTISYIHKRYKWYLESIDERLRDTNVTVKSIKYYLETKI